MVAGAEERGKRKEKSGNRKEKIGERSKQPDGWMSIIYGFIYDNDTGRILR